MVMKQGVGNQGQADLYKPGIREADKTIAFDLPGYQASSHVITCRTSPGLRRALGSANMGLTQYAEHFISKRSISDKVRHFSSTHGALYCISAE